MNSQDTNGERLAEKVIADADRDFQNRTARHYRLHAAKEGGRDPVTLNRAWFETIKALLNQGSVDTAAARESLLVLADEIGAQTGRLERRIAELERRLSPTDPRRP